MPILKPAFFPFKTVLEWWICTFFDEVFLQKITLMWRRWGTSQNFLLAFIDELWKTQKIRILKKWKKKKKIAGDIIILHMCTKNHNHMTYSSWDMQWEHFPQQPRKLKFWRNEKSIWRCHHFKLVQQKTRSNDVCLLRYGVQQT